VTEVTATPPPRRLSSPIERVLASPHRHGFFQTVRLLERWFSQQQGLTPEQALQRLRFRNSLHLGFAASEVEQLRVLGGDGEALPDPATLKAIEITPAFLGLLGGAGTLPAFYTEMLGEREQVHKDSAARAFMDIFLQRAALLLYQAWRKQRLAVRYEQDRRRHFTPMLLALAGVGQEALRDRLRPDEGGVADEAMAYFAGRMQQRPVTADSLCKLLSHYFRVPVKLTQFVGRWYRLGDEHQSALGLRNSGLGQGVLLGARVWQRDQRLRLSLGPMSRQRFQRFLPGEPGAIALREWLSMLTGQKFEYEIRLILRASDVGACVLGGGVKLGLDSFLCTAESKSDRAEAGYQLFALA